MVVSLLIYAYLLCVLGSRVVAVWEVMIVMDIDI